MFFVLVFFILAATSAYLFPAWSWGTVLLASFGCVAMLRIALAVTSRLRRAPRKGSD